MMSIRKIIVFFVQVGIDPRKLYYSCKGFPVYLRNLFLFRKGLKRVVDPGEWGFSLYPVFQDRYLSSGTAKGHYFFQDLWAAKKIFNNSPKKHIDIGSRIDGFVSHLLVFRSVEVIDVREIESNVKDLKFTRIDMTAPDNIKNSYSDSISCLHALEHFGLGRYGDKLDPEGYKKGLEAISKMLENNGMLYLSVPIGKQRIEFDAHRIFNEVQFANLAEKFGLDLVSFSYVDDNGNFHEDVNLNDLPDMNYGCGLFELRKTDHCQD